MPFGNPCKAWLIGSPLSPYLPFPCKGKSYPAMLTLPNAIIIWASADSALNHGLLQCEALNLALCFHFDEQFNPVQPFSLQKAALPPSPGAAAEAWWLLGTWPGTRAARPEGRGRCLTCKSQLLRFLEAAGMSPLPHARRRRREGM